ncbi:hypothetical protein C8F04DRAFT_1185374 [Mycena alexandri]|uniref:Uncharacterized protein n=1 Tax=Mycena alexandri TaxID=1745969 RepID=A0AAD6SQH3_9AGAR|nr:hypothetical protein C8F04DRAFT_1185374 [Mycena alexandri]
MPPRNSGSKTSAKKRRPKVSFGANTGGKRKAGPAGDSDTEPSSSTKRSRKDNTSGPTGSGPSTSTGATNTGGAQSAGTSGGTANAAANDASTKTKTERKAFQRFIRGICGLLTQTDVLPSAIEAQKHYGKRFADVDDVREHMRGLVDESRTSVSAAKDLATKLIRDAKRITGPIANDIARIPEAHLATVFTMILKSGLKGFCPDLDGPVQSTYNQLHRHLAVSAFQFLSSSFALAALEVNARVAEDTELLGDMYDNYTYGTLAQKTRMERRRPGSLSDSIKHNNEFKARGRQKFVSTRPPDLGSASQQRMAFVQEAHSDDEHGAQRSVREKPGRNPVVGMFFQEELDPAAEQYRRRNAKAGQVKPQTRVRSDPLLPASDFGVILPDNVPIDYFTPEFFNALTLKERARYAHEEWKTMGKKEFMEMYGDDVLAQYDVPTQEEIDEIPESDVEDDEDIEINLEDTDDESGMDVDDEEFLPAPSKPQTPPFKFPKASWMRRLEAAAGYQWWSTSKGMRYAQRRNQSQKLHDEAIWNTDQIVYQDSRHPSPRPAHEPYPSPCPALAAVASASASEPAGEPPPESLGYSPQPALPRLHNFGGHTSSCTHCSSVRAPDVENSSARVQTAETRTIAISDDVHIHVLLHLVTHTPADELARPMYNDELVGYDPSGTTSQPPGRSRTAYSLLVLAPALLVLAPAFTYPYPYPYPSPPTSSPPSSAYPIPSDANAPYTTLLSPPRTRTRARRERRARHGQRLRAIQYDPAPATTTPHALDRPYPAGCANERAPPRVGRLWAWRDTRARVRLLVDAEVVDDDDEEEAAAAAAAWGWSEEEVGAAGDNDAQRMTGAGASEEAPPKRGVVSEVMEDDDEPCILAPSKGVYARRRGGGVCGRDDGVQQRRVHSGGAAKTKGPTHLDNKLVRATYNAELVVYDASGTTPPPARSCTAYPLLVLAPPDSGARIPLPIPTAILTLTHPRIPISSGANTPCTTLLPAPAPAPGANDSCAPCSRSKTTPPHSRTLSTALTLRAAPISRPHRRSGASGLGGGLPGPRGVCVCVYMRVCLLVEAEVVVADGEDNDQAAWGWRYGEEEGAAGDNDARGRDIRELRNEVVLRGGWGWVFWVKKDVSASETYGKRYERKRLCRGVLD